MRPEFLTPEQDDGREEQMAEQQDERPELLSFEEAGRIYLGITRQGVAYHANLGHVPVVTCGSLRLIPRRFFEKAIQDAMDAVGNPVAIETS